MIASELIYFMVGTLSGFFLGIVYAKARAMKHQRGRRSAEIFEPRIR